MIEPRVPLLRFAERTAWVLMIALLSGCASIEPHYQFRTSGSDAELTVLTHPTLDNLHSQCSVRLSTRRTGLQTSCNGTAR